MFFIRYTLVFFAGIALVEAQQCSLPAPISNGDFVDADNPSAVLQRGVTLRTGDSAMIKCKIYATVYIGDYCDS